VLEAAPEQERLLVALPELERRVWLEEREAVADMATATLTPVHTVSFHHVRSAPSDFFIGRGTAILVGSIIARHSLVGVFRGTRPIGRTISGRLI
jgi:hypothetical protein